MNNNRDGIDMSGIAEGISMARDMATEQAQSSREYSMATFGKDLAELESLFKQAVSDENTEKEKKILERFKDYSSWVQEHIEIARKLSAFYSPVRLEIQSILRGETLDESAEKVTLTPEKLVFPPPKKYSLQDFE